MAKRIKLTPTLLRRIVLEERDRILRESDPIDAGIDDVEKVDAEEKDADEQQDTLAKDVMVPELVEYDLSESHEAEEAQALLESIRAIPTFILWEDGKEVTRFMGYSNQDRFYQQLSEALEEREPSKG